jgi:hypothetical protein
MRSLLCFLPERLHDLEYSHWLNNAYIFWLIFLCGFCVGFVAAGLLFKTIDTWKETRKLFKAESPKEKE